MKGLGSAINFGFVAVALLAIFTVGCTVGPEYKRPAAPVPDTWKG